MIFLPFYFILSIYTLWLFYLAVMNLQRARDAGTLTKIAYYLGLPILYVGLMVDFIVNMIPVSILFFEFPHEMLVTPRLQRHVHGPDTRRKRLALWFCKNLLDVFDPSGNHCKELK